MRIVRPLLAVLPVVLTGVLLPTSAAVAAADGWGKSGLYVLQQCLNAVQVGAFYGLLAAAYVLIYGICNRINLAFGALAMWAGYMTVAGVTILAALSPLGLAATIVFAALYAIAGTAVLGYGVQHSVVLPLIRASSLAMLIATVGLAITLEEVVRLARDSRERWLQPLLGDPIRLLEADGFSITITPMRAVILVASLVLSAALIGLVSRHRFGRIWRACSQDLGMAELCGININVVLAVVFLLSASYAGAAGAIIALYYGNVSFYMGTVLGLKTLLAAVVGGLGSVTGAVAGGFLLGALESFWSAYFSGDYRDVAVFGVLMGLMIWRPNGLLTPTTRPDHDRG
ncbi:MAG: branched-chain amino acid ABC transporter permease [Alphaproteobacteria bacterium]|nr:branched-chain amino acid ABC transporter permease [Alphaproteobacteria bacterium]